MTILLTRVALNPNFMVHVPPLYHEAALFALVAASNIGAVFTLIGGWVGCCGVWGRVQGQLGKRRPPLPTSRTGTHCTLVQPLVLLPGHRANGTPPLHPATPPPPPTPRPRCSGRPAGALAGIMWNNILRARGSAVTYAHFAAVGCPIGAASMVVALLVIWAEFVAFP